MCALVYPSLDQKIPALRSAINIEALPEEKGISGRGFGVLFTGNMISLCSGFEHEKLEGWKLNTSEENASA